MSSLFIVATPIGNLQDITLRALDVLREVDAVYAEDTRVTRTLFERHGIVTPLFSYREAAPRPQVEKMIDGILVRLTAGESVAYVSDAGTPGISDPGDYLVSRVRAAGFPVVPVPGASSLTALLSVAGAGIQRPLFIGFLPHKKGRETLLRQVSEALTAGPTDGVVIFEAPTRVVKLLQAVAAWPFPARVWIGRELTKKFEEIIVGMPEDVLAHFTQVPPRGEFVLVIRPDLLK